ncbi:asparagine synthase (glutamine-hydrolyzing) [Ammoniphilus sp. YIM 78166]|uniref:asparagine synthase (glutamine-hydrolyzing) n=1 Tax=Ammoniphilus sp. YIM 78166 TaxID=1644106 RepID=UPI00106F3973|nr:asparagine synthase (glutamine-hydrolyzing) [Ammoniphilus sp. YIM 78166]
MCGINGLINVSRTGESDNLGFIAKMNEQIIHRGPDSAGVYTDEYVGLGMRRLAIIDINSGEQPIFNEDRSKVVVFNGEIYNYRTLRNRLVGCGHHFRTESDTEVIVHAYEEYGDEFLCHLEGMFALALYDIKEKRLILARDRAGEKPLYYYRNGNRLAFCSELKSLIKVFDISKEGINREALNQYLSLTYIPAPLTIYNKVYKLMPGHFLSYKEGDIKVQSYWDFRPSSRNFIEDYDQCKTELRKRLFESVERQMVSDVPLGAFLSGGIDSSVIVGIMSRMSNRPIETFSIGFKEKEFDESEKALAVSKLNKTNHHLHILTPESILEYLEVIVSSMDEPFADSSMLPTYFVSKFTKEKVTVALTGDGGDELFGGYSKYMIHRYSKMYNSIPQFLRKGVIERVLYSAPDSNKYTRQARKVVENSHLDEVARRRNMMMMGANEQLRSELLTEGYYDADSLGFIGHKINQLSDMDELARTLFTDFSIILEGDMLAKVDRMSMLNSLETRVPMLDKGVIELAFQVPSYFKIKGNVQKYILKDTFSDMLPMSIMRQKKHGFGVPLDVWFRGPLKSELLQLIDYDRLQSQGIFNPETVKRIVHEHLKAKKNHSWLLWSIYVFQKWFDNYFGQTSEREMTVQAKEFTYGFN